MAVINPRDNFKIAASLGAANHGSDADGAAVDTRGFEYACAIFATGSITSTDFDLVLEEADDAGFTTGVAEVGKFEGLTGGGGSPVDNEVFAIGARLQGRKRYLRTSIVTSASVFTSGPILLTGMDRSNDLKELASNFIEF